MSRGESLSVTNSKKKNISGNVHLILMDICIFVYNNRLDGFELGVVDIGDSEKPRSIAVHSMKRLLFWSDVGSQQSVYRSRIDGADRMTLAFKLDGIAAIAVDQQLDLLFFAYNKRIDVMDLDGRNKYAQTKEFFNLFGLTIIDNNVYFQEKSSINSYKSSCFISCITRLLLLVR